MNKIQKILLHSATFMAAILSLSSCYENVIDETINESEVNCIVVADPERETGYDCMLLAPSDGYVDLIKMDSDKNLEEIIVLHGNEYKEAAIIRFHENGLVKSLSVDSVTLVFSNYQGNKVDVALIYDGEMSVIKEFECQGDWEQYISVQNGEQTRSLSERQVDGLYFFKDQLSNVLDFAIESRFNIAEAGKNAFEFLISIVGDTWKLLDDNEESLVTFGFNTLTVTQVAKTLLDTRIPSLVGLGILIMNYDTYVDWVASLSYSIIGTVDELLADEELAISTLNSGYGALKVTLSWNFYADIDLHAYEPSGSHIWWHHKYSSSGGFLDVDNTEGGAGAVENIYWENPQEGTYSFYIHYYGSSSYNYVAQSGICRVAILYKGQSLGIHNISMTEYSTEDVQTISLKDGVATRSALPDINFEFVIDRNIQKNY